MQTHIYITNICAYFGDIIPEFGIAGQYEIWLGSHIMRKNQQGAGLKCDISKGKGEANISIGKGE